MFVRSAVRCKCYRIVVVLFAGTILPLGLARASDDRDSVGKNGAEKVQQIAVTIVYDNAVTIVYDNAVTIVYDNAVTIVYDNNAFDNRMETAWGFACVVEGLSETILFDTGGKGPLLLANMAKAGFEPAQIHSVVLSHDHNDHTGGLLDFLKANPKVKVFVPKAFAASFRQEVKKSGAEMVETEGPVEVCDGAWTTGVLKQPLAEQGLCLETSDGPVVITGCAHPGIAHMARAATRRTRKPVHVVLGGFHMSRATAAQIDAVIGQLRENGVRHVAPTHCSGNNTRQAMKDAFGDRYLPSGLGTKFAFQQAARASADTAADNGRERAK